MAWGKNGTPNTLTGTNANVEVSDCTGKKFNVYLSHTFVSTSADQNFTYNSSTGNLYSYRQTEDGGADGTSAPVAFINNRYYNDQDHFMVHYSCWISGEEKLTTGFVVSPDASGAGTAPHRVEFSWKYVPASLTDTLTNVKINKGSFTNFATGSNLTVIGTD